MNKHKQDKKPVSAPLAVPQDSNVKAPSSPVGILEKVAETLGPNGENWRKGSADGPICFCLFYAVIHVSQTARFKKETQAALDIISEAIGTNNIGDWNDHHRWPTVKRALGKAIQIAKERGL